MELTVLSQSEPESRWSRDEAGWLDLPRGCEVSLHDGRDVLNGLLPRGKKCPLQIDDLDDGQKRLEGCAFRDLPVRRRARWKP